MQNKKAVSPLIATVLLVMIVVSVGAAVMLVIRNLSDEQIQKIETSSREIQCGTEVKPRIVAYGTSYKYCYDPTTRNVTVMFENQGDTKIEGWRITVIGDSVYDREDTACHNDTYCSELNTSQIRTFHWNYDDVGTVEYIRILPLVTGAPGKEIVTCREPALEWEEEDLAGIPSCPMS
ncbi:hypothetical protein JW930_01785 [Candidatus Woesearchaeota archaeon]|nr:hypothetical protein [Candidatus Woesearchaeota archaeon]